MSKSPLEVAADRVINSSEIKTLLSEYLLSGSINASHNPLLIPYEILLRFQIDQSPKLSKGFQIGEPWSGDIAKAPILFVSKAPSYSLNEIFPRYLYNINTKDFVIVKTSDVSKDNNSVMKDSDVLAFFNNRFLNALAPQGYGLHIEIDAQTSDNQTQTSKAVKYWGAMRNNTRTLLSLSKKPCRIRDVINYFACTSIVPFKINLKGQYKNALDANTLRTCWETFSKDIITLSNARVIVLVGQEVFDTFTSGFNIDVDKYSLKETSESDSNNRTKEIYLFEHKIGNTIRYIVNIAANQGDMRNFKNYFVKGSNILKKLQKVVADGLN